ncbi:MAG: PH domain-containing protein, partial [Rubrivivax sp.]|nr:PH domain-containing protein [Rubrivivax sp.]
MSTDNTARLERHKHVAGHEHEFEPVRGLPEALPAGEHVLWQGSPRWQSLAVQAFHVRKLVWYFAALVVLRLVLMESASATAMAISALWLVLLGGAAIGALSLVAWLSARGTVYTLTNRRIVMRVGIVLTLAFNIPLQRLAGAGRGQHPPPPGAQPPWRVCADPPPGNHPWAPVGP